MGHITARGIAETEMSLEQQLAWHLQSNHFPPVPTSMVEACVKAIDAMNEGDYTKMIGLPEGVGYKGLTAAPASAIAEAHHLDVWIQYDEFEGEDF